MYNLIFYFITILCIISNHWVDGDGALKVSIYYEHSCPAYQRFFSQQFLPNYLEFKEIVEWDLIPYGNAKQFVTPDGNLEIKCQHGENECLADMTQACALQKIQDLEAKMKFISCYMSAGDTQKDMECALSSGVDYSAIKECATSNDGLSLLATLGDKQKSQQPTLSWVPAIAFDGALTKEDSSAAFHDLVGEICKRVNVSDIPGICLARK